MTKDTVPQDFSLGLALFDALPVILFGMGTWLLWKMTGSVIVIAGAVICFLSGVCQGDVTNDTFLRPTSGGRDVSPATSP